MKTRLGRVCAKHPALGGLRLASSRLCVECNRKSAREWRKAHPTYSAEYGRKRYAANREEIKTKDAAKYAENPEPKRASSAVWRKANRPKCNAYEARRRVKMLVPLTPQEKEDVVAVYEKARALTELVGERYHVDHKIPVAKGGLHHPANLQVLRAVDNLKKGVRV